MTGQIELFNILTIIFLIGGIVFTGVALFVFFRFELREYYVLKRHIDGKEVKKSNKTKKEAHQSSDHDIDEPIEVLKDLKPAQSKTEKKSKKRIVEPKENKSIEEVSIDEGSEETIALKDGSGKTEDLCKPSSIQENKDEEDEDILTGVLDDDTTETAVLDKGEKTTSVLEVQHTKLTKRNTIRDNALWGAPLSNNKMVEAHNIVMVNTTNQAR